MTAAQYWFDEKAADLWQAFFERCLFHTKGEFAGKPFTLQPWQRDRIIRPLFGWKRRDHDDPARCTRRYRRCYIEVPKKNGKTQMAAGIGVGMLTLDGEAQGEVYSIAAKKEQAELVYFAALNMIAASPHLNPHFELFKSKIYHPRSGSLWAPLAGTSTGKDGKNPSLILGDEVHEWPDAELHDKLTTGMAARKQPLDFRITTAGARLGFGFQTHQWAKKIAEGTLDDPETLVVIYGASLDDDWNDPKIWEAANPSYGVTVNPEMIKSLHAKAKDNPNDENKFKRYHLNIWTEQAIRWLPMHKWALCDHSSPLDHMYAMAQLAAAQENAPFMHTRREGIGWIRLLQQMRGRTCYIGVDLSSTTDLTAVIYVFPPAGDDPLTRVACRFYMPADNIEARIKRDRVPFDKWALAGAVTLTEGNTVDHEQIFADILEDTAALDVAQIGLDKWNSAWIGPKLADHFRPNRRGSDGKMLDRVLTVAQNGFAMSPGCKELERLVVSEMLDHGGHPVLRWMASNVSVAIGRQGDITPIKDKSSDATDGIIGAVIALTLAGLDAVPQGPSVYEDRGLIWL